MKSLKERIEVLERYKAQKLKFLQEAAMKEDVELVRHYLAEYDELTITIRTAKLIEMEMEDERETTR